FVGPFGNSAGVASERVSVRGSPGALRLRLSTGLPFSRPPSREASVARDGCPPRASTKRRMRGIVTRGDPGQARCDAAYENDPVQRTSAVLQVIAGPERRR